MRGLQLDPPEPALPFPHHRPPQLQRAEDGLGEIVAAATAHRCADRSADWAGVGVCRFLGRKAAPEVSVSCRVPSGPPVWGSTIGVSTGRKKRRRPRVRPLSRVQVTLPARPISPAATSCWCLSENALCLPEEEEAAADPSAEETKETKAEVKRSDLFDRREPDVCVFVTLCVCV